MWGLLQVWGFRGSKPRGFELKVRVGFSVESLEPE